MLLHIASIIAANRFVLVIDAGHGGHDAGAVGKYSKEKNINLAVALAFGRYVEQNCSDVKVVYTRKTDIFVPLHERANIANRNHADVFISIHTNALPGKRIARGLETYTMGMRRSDEKLSAAQRENSVITFEDNYEQHYAGYDPNSPESMIMFEFIHDKNMEKSVELAKLVQTNVCSIAQRQNKGVKQDAFLVLRETSMPACLIELGFISTPDEEDALNNKRIVDRMAYGIYTAFARFKDKNVIVAPYVVNAQHSADQCRVLSEGVGDVYRTDYSGRDESTTGRLVGYGTEEVQPSALGSENSASFPTGSSGEYPSSDEGLRTTGWEDSRKDYERFLGKGFGLTPSNNGSQGATGYEKISYPLGDMRGLIGGGIGNLGASLSSVFITDDEDEEERRKRIQAEENGEAVGALLGFAAGAVMSAYDDQSDDDGQTMESL